MIDHYLRQHDGLITLTQAESSGLSRHAVNRRVRSGRWRTCAPGVFFVDDRPFTDAARIRAAVWGLGVDAAASGLAAAWWHGITKYAPTLIEVTVPRDAHRVQRDGIRTRRRDLGRADVVECRGLRVTELALTVVEAATRRGDGASVMDTALQRHTNLPDLWRAHLRTKGRHGAPAARRLLHAADDGARSTAERLLIQLLKRAQITGWRPNRRIAGYEVDVVFRLEKVIVEVDGFAFHTDAETFQRDRNKQNALALAGWHVLRFTWLDLTQYPERVVAEIRQATCGV